MNLSAAWLLPLLLGIVVVAPLLILFVQELRAARTLRQTLKEKQQ